MAGRKKKYHTDEERKEANRIKAQKYYEKHKDKVRANNLAKYHEKKIGSI